MGSSSRRSLTRAVILLTAAVLLVRPEAVETEPHHGRGWVGTWTASSQPASSPLPINGQTLRQIVHTSIGGDSVRIRLSNQYSEEDVVVGAVRVAVSAGGAAIVEATSRVLRFNGSPTITISAGTFVVSDPVRLPVPALGDLAVSIYLPGNVAATTGHDLGLQTNYLSAPGDFTGTADFTGTTTQSYHFLTTVEVRAQERAGAIVTLGESVTDGVGSTPDTNQRWTNLLAERLQEHPRTSDMAVLNAGIGGNRILHDIFGPSGLSRLDRDVLVQSGAAHLIVSPGIPTSCSRTDRATRAERRRRPDHPGPPADHHARTGDGPARLRRDAAPHRWLPVSGILDDDNGGEASASQSVHSHERRVRWGHRFRQGIARSRPADTPATRV